MEESVKAKGRVVIEVRDRDGNLKLRFETNNTITDLGKSHFADRLIFPPTQDPMCAMAIGTGTPSTTALGSETTRRGFKSLTSSGHSTIYTGHWDIDDNFSATITEAGIFNKGALGGTMLCSAIISPSISKGLTDSLDITWTVKFD